MKDGGSNVYGDIGWGDDSHPCRTNLRPIFGAVQVPIVYEGSSFLNSLENGPKL